MRCAAPAETGCSTPGTLTSGMCDHPSLRNRSETQTKKKQQKMWGCFSPEMVQMGCLGAAAERGRAGPAGSTSPRARARRLSAAALACSATVLCRNRRWHSQGWPVCMPRFIFSWFSLFFFFFHTRSFFSLCLSLCPGTMTGSPA